MNSSFWHRRRMQMDLAGMGVPEVPLLGRYNHIRAEIALPEHAHGDILEICFLVKGRQTYRVGGRDYHLRGGDVFIAFPHQKHSTAGNPQEKGVLYWMMIRKTGRNLFGFSAEQSRVFWKSLCSLPPHFRGSWKMKDHLNSLASLCNGSAFPLRPAFMSTEALVFLLEVLKCARAEEKPKSPVRKIEMALDYVREHLDECIRVPVLAARSGLSTARFKVRFKEEMGMPPGEYMLRMKINEARQRLVSGKETVTDIAYALGFSSSQYFATVFKRFSGETPSAVLKRKIAGTREKLPKR